MAYSKLLNSTDAVEIRTASGLGTGSLLITRDTGPGDVWASPVANFSTGVVKVPSSPDVTWPAGTALYMRGYGTVTVGTSAFDVYGLINNGPVTSVSNPLTGVNAIRAGNTLVLPTRREAVRIAEFGDSFASVGIPSGNLSDARVVSVPFPASGATLTGLNQTYKYLLQCLYPQAYCVADCGISGTTTATMVARDAGAYSTTRKAMKDALDLGPDVVVLKAGSPNDFGTVTMATWQAQADATFANHRTLVSRALAGGAIVIDWGFAGYGDGALANATDPAAVRLACLYLNGLYKAHAERFLGQVFFIDAQAIGVQQSDGKFAPGMSDDGVHVNIYGGWRFAVAEARILTGLFGVSSGPRYAGQNLITNAMMQDQSGGLATGITLPAPTNGAWSSPQIEYINGQIWQTAVFTPSAAAAQATMSLYNAMNGLITGMTLNDVTGIEFDYMIEGVGANPVPTYLYGVIDIVKSGAGRIIEYVTAGYEKDSQTSFGRLVFQPLRFNDVTTISINGAGAAGIVYKTDTVAPVKIGLSNPRFVKLNQPVTTI